jgi:hypothetical protein
MRRYFTVFVLFTILIGSTAFAQNSARRADVANSRVNVPIRPDHNSDGRGRSASNGSSDQFIFPAQPSSIISLPNSSYTGIGGNFDLQVHGRGLHNLQVDPSDPMKMHFCAMTTTSKLVSDTTGGNYPSRRIVYSYSSDGGAHWSAPKIVSGSVRTGYPDMVLYKRGNSYVPIIAAHRYEPESTTSFISAIYVENGAPGEGNFVETTCSHVASDQNEKDLLWPSIALSKDMSKLFILGDFSNQNNGAAMDYMEFGSFSLGADAKAPTFDGWTAQPGKGEDISQGYCQSGKHVIRVGEDGRIGVMWVNPDAGNGDHNMYFVESNDGGKTWPSTILPLIPSVIDFDNNRGLSANNGLDFIYIGNKPHFIWEADELIFNESDSNGFYFPYTAQVFYWGLGDDSVKCINFNDNQGYIINTIQVNENGTQRATGVQYLYQNTNFFAANIPQTTPSIDLPTYGAVGLTTFAPTTDPNVFGVFYQSISDNDYATTPDRDGSDVNQWYGGIFYQYTTDGGATWTAPASYKSNSNPGDPATALDYRYPETSMYETAGGGSINFKVAFQVDSLAGLFDTREPPANNGAGYSTNYWYYEGLSKSGVHSSTPNALNILGQNYPNPVQAVSTIPVVMPENGQVTLTVEDLLGRSMQTVYSGELSSGSHNIPVKTASLAPGVYRYTIKTPSGSDSRLMTVIH